MNHDSCRSIVVISLMLFCMTCCIPVNAEDPYVITTLPFEINETVVSALGTHQFLLGTDWTGTAGDPRAILITAHDVIFDGDSHILTGTLDSDPQTDQTGIGVNADNVTVRNIQVAGWDGGIFYYQSNDGVISGTLTDQNVNAGIGMFECSQIALNNNRAGGSIAGDGINVVNSTRIWLDNNDATGNAHNGIAFNNVFLGGIMGGDFSDNNDNGIGIWQNSRNISAGGNTVSGTINGPGINVGDGEYIDILDNLISGIPQGPGIVCGNVTNGNIVNNTVSDTREMGIGVFGCEQVGVNDNHANGSAEANGIDVGDSTRIWLNNNEAAGNAHTGISFNNVFQGVIMGGDVSDNNDNGIGIWQSRNISEGGNYVTGTVNGPGINVGDGEYIDILDNLISGIPQGPGIICGNITGGNIVNNTVTGARDAGIGLIGCSQIGINDNHATGSGEGDGIWVTDSTRIWVVNNEATGNAHHGIAFNNVFLGGIMGGDFSDNNDNGIGIWQNSRNISIGGNTIDGTVTGTGINAGDGEHIDILDNQVSGISQGPGIICGNITGGNIVNNTVSDIREMGIGIFGCDQFGVNDNQVMNSADADGIAITDSTRIWLGNNEATGNAHTGISFNNVFEGSITGGDVSNNNDNGIGVRGNSRNISAGGNHVAGTINGSGINIDSGEYIDTFDNVVTGCTQGTGILYTGVAHGNVVNNTLTGNRYSNIGINSCDQVGLNDNRAEGSTEGDGISVGDSTRIWVGNNNATGNANNGVAFSNVSEGGIFGGDVSENTYNGIGLWRSRNISVGGNRVAGTTDGTGINVDTGENIDVFDNEVAGNTKGAGVLWRNVAHGNVANNSMTGNRDSNIGLYSCDQIAVNDNHASGSGEGDGISVGDSTRIWVGNNNATGNAHNGVSFSNVSEGGIFGGDVSGNNDNGIGVWGSSENISVGGNRVNGIRNGHGINADTGENIGIFDNEITGNERGSGIIYNHMTGGNIVNNTVSDNGESGLGIYMSDGFVVNTNTVRGNGGPGVAMGESFAGLVYNNYFDNSVNVMVWQVNDTAWNIEKTPGDTIAGGGYLGGNYWGNPDGMGFSQVTPDLDGDGICDSPLVINEENTDYLPLAEQTAFRISPRVVTNSSTIEIQVFGQNFTDGMLVRLDNGGSVTLAATHVILAPPGRLVTYFNLTQAPVGEYSLTLEWPDHSVVVLPSALQISDQPAGAVAYYPDVFIGAGQTVNYTMYIPQSHDLVVTLQKVPLSSDPHYSWNGRISVIRQGEVIADNEGNQDQVLHIVDAPSDTYTLSLTSPQAGRGILAVWTALPQLPPGSWVDFPIHRPYGTAFTRVQVPAGQEQLTISSEAIGDWSHFMVFYEQFGGQPRWVSSYGPDASLTIPTPEPGTYFIGFTDTQMISGEDQDRDILLKADLTGGEGPPPVSLPAITSVTPTRGGNTGTLTMEIKGASLDRNATVTLVAATAGSIPAVSVQGAEDNRSLRATFDLANRTAGTYSVVVGNPGGYEITSPVPFILEEGGHAELWTEIVGRENIRLGRPATYTLKYGNRGTLDMPAPLLSLSTEPLSENIYVRFGSSSEWHRMDMDASLIVKGSGPAGDPDVLPAGSEYSIIAEVRSDEENKEFSLVLTPYGGDPMFSPPVIDTALDAFCPEPGIPLSFGRSFPGGYSSYLGPLGYGWTHSYDMRLVLLEDGNIGLESGNEFPLILRPNGTDVYEGQYGEPRLERTPEATYLLEEPDGTKMNFRSDLLLDSISDPNGNRLTMGYNAQDRLVRIDHSSGDLFTLDYNGNGRISGLTDHTGNRTQYLYDDTGSLLTRVTDPGGRSLDYTYESNEAGAALASRTTPDGITTTFGHDGDGHLSMTSLSGNQMAVPLEYDVANRTTTISDATGSHTKLRVNEFGRVVSAENSIGDVQRYSFDSRQNLVSATDPLGNTSSYIYDDANRLTAIIDVFGATTQFTYNDLFNAVDSVTDPLGHAKNFSYDSRGNLLDVRFPNSLSETYTYDSRGNLERKVTRNGGWIDYHYNNRGQVTGKEYSDGSFVSYSYDPQGLLLTATNSLGTISMEYNDMDLLTRITYPDGLSLNYTYDSSGRIIRRGDASGHTQSYYYDETGTLTRVSDENGRDIVQYAYDDAGRISRKSLSNGAYTTYEYDETGRIQKMANFNPNSDLLSSWLYHYDARSLPVSVDVTDGTWYFEYDAAGQLTGFTTPAGATNSTTRYSYDAAGNRVSVVTGSETIPYTTNSMNQYTRVGSLNLSYDANGNVIATSKPGMASSFTYDVENRLVGLTDPMGNSVEYRYDALGQRAAIVRNGIETKFLNDPSGIGNVVGIYDGNNTLNSRYIYGIGLVSRIDARGNEYPYFFGPTGNTIQIMAPNGTIANRYRYAPFGEFLAREETVPNPFCFAGEYGVMDEGNNGLSYMRARYYASYNMGRFITEDPVYQLGQNPYVYCKNNPNIYLDPTGEETGYIEIFKIPGILKVHTGADSRGPHIGIGPDNGPAIIHIRPSDTHIRAFGENFNLPYVQGLLKAGGIVTSVLDGVGVFNPQPLNEGEDEFLKNEGKKDPQPIITSAPKDPEDKYGPQGYDQPGTPRTERKHFIPQGQALAYRIDIWNDENASAPVCDVYAFDQMDIHLNKSTFAFTEVGFLNHTIPLGNVRYFSLYVPCPELNLTVSIEGNYDPVSGNATLTYRSLDPFTLQTPDDPMAGFLPANVNGNDIAWFSYTIAQTPGLSTGTEIMNQAWVNFDGFGPYNPAPMDGPYRNTIDASPPASSMTAVLVNGTVIRATIAGADSPGGSGIKDYTVSLSDNGGPYNAVMNHVTESNVTLSGLPGHTYRYYSLARDNVGNIEGVKSVPDGTITIPVPIPPPIARFAMNYNSGPAPLGIFFTDNSANDPVEWDWNFGDGSAWQNGTSRNLSHTYQNTGTFTAMLVVKNGAGSDVALRTVVVVTPPPALSSIAPAKHKHDNRAFTATIKGSGFRPGTPGTNVTLTNPLYPIIKGTSVNVVSTEKITCKFRISKKAKPGLRNVTVTSPDGQSATLVNKFKVTT